jgi:squalene-hopene/tetraprenyl-beta-curcumene cyclase
MFITDTSITAYYILLMHYLDMVDEARQAKAVRYILNEQQMDGSWNGYPGGRAVLDIMVLDYLALKLAGISANAPEMVKARNIILAKGGAEMASVLPKIMLALFGQVPWTSIPPLNTNLMLFEELLYHIGYHRSFLIPLLVIYENYYKVELNQDRCIQELFLEDPWAGVQESRPRKGCCQEKALNWILKRQEDDGNWSGVFNNTMYCLMALKSTGDSSYSNVILKGIQGVLAFQNEDEETLNQQFSRSPIMDTGYIIDVLVSAGVDSNNFAIQKAIDWLLSKEMTTYGDWHHLNPQGDPGGWSFEHYNQWYPDVDCTVIVLRGFSALSDDHLYNIREPVQRAINWVISMQNRDGGWAAWDKDVLDLASLIPLLNSPWLIADTSSADLTARVLTGLLSISDRIHWSDPAVINRAIQYIKDEQKEVGYWWGRWGVNYTYCTGEVLKGLAIAGENPYQKYIQKAISWLKSIQNPDGGWGESPRSYEDTIYAGVGESTATQTAYVLTGLIYSGEVNCPEVKKGIRYLLDTQNQDGSWSDLPFMGTNVPHVWYARYNMASTYKPADTLAQYLRFKDAFDM